MPIYTLSDGREANVGPENEERFLNDFAELEPKVKEEDQVENTNINFNEPPVEETEKRLRENNDSS